MTDVKPIPFTRVHVTGREALYTSEVIESSRLAGDGVFTRRCEEWLQRTTGCVRALLTSSGTAALEMAAMLAGIEAGDEVIMPSFTFSSTANAFVLRGAVPVFVDIDPDTLNIDPAAVEAAVGPRTRAIVPVHYAGLGCDMDAILDIARRAQAVVIEDAAQGILSTWKGRALGTFGASAALSFHETKNVTSGEGGCLLINDPALIEQAEICREKGTDRSRFHRGEIDKYSWVGVGSSYLLSELSAAFLLAQLEASEEITVLRRKVWERYHTALAPLEAEGLLRRPVLTSPNAHIYYVLLPDLDLRTRLTDALRAEKITAVFHYVPLHSSRAGLQYGRANALPVTDSVSDRLLRLPLWSRMTEADVERVTTVIARVLR